MATTDQLPDRLDVRMVAGDDFSFTLDFDIDLTGYTFEAKRGADAITVTGTDLAGGALTVSVTDTQSASWVRGRQGWWLAGTVGGITRTYVAGIWELRPRERP